MAEPLKVYSWRVKDLTSPWRKKKGDPWYTLSWKMAEEEAREWAAKNGHSEIERVEGSEEVRHPITQTQGMVMSGKHRSVMTPNTSDIAITVSKLDSVRRQLETAIALYFCRGDEVSIHTLTAAAYNVIRGISQNRGGNRMLVKDVAINDWVKPEYQSEVGKQFNAAENFFKHAFPNPDGTIELHPEYSSILMFDAGATYQRLTNELPHAILCHRIWFMSVRQHWFLQSLPRELSEGMQIIRDMKDRGEFYEHWMRHIAPNAKSGIGR